MLRCSYHHGDQVETLLTLTDNSYVYKEVIKMELLVLKVLKFELFLPTPCIFVDRLLKVVKSDDPKVGTECL